MVKAASPPPLRRSSRVNARIPVRLSGTLPSGKPFTEETFVVSISKFGAKVKTRQPLEVGIRVKVQPHRRREAGLFKVVWMGRPDTPREGEAGIEYVEVSNLLGIAFPD
jgi:hypothetical protein